MSKLFLTWMWSYFTVITALPCRCLRIAMTSSIATVLCFRGMMLRSMISDLKLSCGSWVIYNYILWLCFRTSWILQKCKRQFEALCVSEQQTSRCRPCYVNIPWTDVIVACIDYKIGLLDYSSGSGDEVRYMDYFRYLSAHDDGLWW